MPTAGNPRITIRLDPATMARLHTAARNAGTDTARLVRALVLDHLDHGWRDGNPLLIPGCYGGSHRDKVDQC